MGLALREDFFSPPADSISNELFLGGGEGREGERVFGIFEQLCSRFFWQVNHSVNYPRSVSGFFEEIILAPPPPPPNKVPIPFAFLYYYYLCCSSAVFLFLNRVPL